MKVNSVLTQDVDGQGRVVSESKTTFKKKPDFQKGQDPFYLELVEKSVNEHTSRTEGVERFIVTVSTTSGKYIKTFKAHKVL